MYIKGARQGERFIASITLVDLNVIFFLLKTLYETTSKDHYFFHNV